MRIPRVMFFVLATCASGPTFAQGVGGKAAPSTSSSPAGIPADVRPLLSKLQEAVDSAIASKRGDKLAAELESLRVAEYLTWLPATFGLRNGVQLANAYPDLAKEAESRLVEHFVTRAEGGGQIIANIALQPTEQEKTEFQQQFNNAVVQSLQHPTDFYRVYYKSIDKATGYLDLYPLGYLTLVEGPYRLIYDHLLRALPDMPVERVRMSSYEAGTLLVFVVRPGYPEEAKRRRIGGLVRLHAIIGRDGFVKKLEVISGEPLLNPAAEDAVRQWRYRPATLSGEAAEVDTVVEVVFDSNR